MHQPIYIEDVVDDYLKFRYPDIFNMKVTNHFQFLLQSALRGNTKKLILETVEYTDGCTFSEMVDLMEVGCREMDFIQWFAEEVNNQDEFEENWC